MSDILKKIISVKHEEVIDRKRRLPLKQLISAIEGMPKSQDFLYFSTFLKAILNNFFTDQFKLLNISSPINCGFKVSELVEIISYIK